MTTEPARFYGKYRGMVLNNIDPMQQGRLQVQVPEVANVIPLTWAMPCVPFGSSRREVPPVGADVWIQFEQGDPSRPVWTGTWWTHPIPPEGARVDRSEVTAHSWSEKASTLRRSPETMMRSPSLTTEVGVAYEKSLPTLLMPTIVTP